MNSEEEYINEADKIARHVVCRYDIKDCVVIVIDKKGYMKIGSNYLSKKDIDTYLARANANAYNNILDETYCED